MYHPKKTPGQIIPLNRLKLDLQIGRAKGRRREDRRLDLRKLPLLEPGRAHRRLLRAA